MISGTLPFDVFDKYLNHVKGFTIDGRNEMELETTECDKLRQEILDSWIYAINNDWVQVWCFFKFLF